jgi:sigma-B regulation protein RsbU (phosphoserine phosphatase)
MSDVATAPLPLAAFPLLDSFHRAHPEAGVCLWLDGGGEWRCLFPVDGPPARPTPGAARRRVAGGAGSTLELEFQGTAEAGIRLDFLAESLEQLIRYEQEARAAARELSERYEEINLLYSISEVLGSVLSLSEAAQRILAEVAGVMSARRASLWILDSEDQQLHLAAAVGADGLTGPIPIDDPESVTAQVFRQREVVNVERGRAYPPGPATEHRPTGQEAFLSVPINFSPRGGGSRTVGVITLVGRVSSPRFNAGDARLLMAIASQVGAALETHRLMAESVRQERLMRELELAHNLQLKLLPEASQFEGPVQVAARCAPADSVGGDFYYLFRFSGDRLGVMIGDVSSHGFSAALIMAMAISAAAIYAQEAETPAEVLRQVHRALIDELESTEMHLSLFYAVLEPAAGRLVYSNAGHPHAFRIDGEGKTHRLGALNPPLGTVPLDLYDAQIVEWERERDLLFLFTDGLSDAFAPSGGAGGEAKLLEEAVKLRGRRPSEILDRLFHLASRRRTNVPPDDRTSVLLKA